MSGSLVTLSSDIVLVPNKRDCRDNDGDKHADHYGAVLIKYIYRSGGGGHNRVLTQFLSP